MFRIHHSLLVGLWGLALLFGACSAEPESADVVTPSASETATSDGVEAEPLSVGAIPDQDPEELQRLYSKLADYLSEQLDMPVEYQPVTDYTAAVTAFKVGDLDLVWFGGLTGVQARLQVEGATAIAQRDIDEQFHSVFIANTGSGIDQIDNISGLTALKGHTFTFGSESSTSGRLMPQYFLQQAGLSLADFRSEPGFSSSHDATLKLVEAGTYDAGALNEQVWLSRVEAGEVDQSRVKEIWRTPAYYDYHWVVNPEVEARYGEGFTEKIQAALLQLDPSDSEQAEILSLFGAEKFIATENQNYEQIEAIGREIGKIK